MRMSETYCKMTSLNSQMIETCRKMIVRKSNMLKIIYRTVTILKSNMVKTYCGKTSRNFNMLKTYGKIKGLTDT